MAKHSLRHPPTGRYMSAKTPEPTGSKPHRTGHRGGKSDIDRDMEANAAESLRYTEGRWDDSEDYDKAARSGLDGREDWKGRGNTVAGVYQGSQHRRKGAGYDVQEHAKVSEQAHYDPGFGPRFPEHEPKVYDARGVQRHDHGSQAAETPHELFLMTGE